MQKDPSSRKKNEAMVHILVLTQKNVACCRELSELPIFLCDDKADGEPDYTLLAFLPFLNAVPQQKPSGFMFSLLGDIHSTEDFSNAIAYAHTLRADLVVWYSFAMTAQSEGMVDPAVQEAVQWAVGDKKVVIYPFMSMPFLDLPGAIPVAGVKVEDAVFKLPFPAQTMVNEPKVVSTGSWTEFQRVWERTNLLISVPDTRRRMEGHALAIWSVTAVAAWCLLARKTKGLPGQGTDLEEFLRGVCVPVQLQPEQARATYGYLDPRRVAELGDKPWT